MYNSKELEQQADCGSQEVLRVPSLRQNVERDLQRAEANVARCRELLALLDSNPEVNRIMELLGSKY